MKVRLRDREEIIKNWKDRYESIIFHIKEDYIDFSNGCPFFNVWYDATYDPILQHYICNIDGVTLRMTNLEIITEKDYYSNNFNKAVDDLL